MPGPGRYSQEGSARSLLKTFKCAWEEKMKLKLSKVNIICNLDAVVSNLNRKL